MSQSLDAPKVKLVPWWLVLIEGILLIIIGIFLLTRPVITWTSLVWVIGLYWLISGIFNIIKIFFDSSMWGWKILAGIVGIIAGYYLITTPFGGTLVFTATVVLLLGLFGIFIGIVNLIQAFRGAGWGTGILGVVSIILGILILSNQQAFILSLPWAVGVLAILGGIIAIFNAFRVRSVEKDIEKAAEAAQARAARMADTAVDSSKAAAAATAGAVAAAAATTKDAADDAVDAAGDAVDEAADTAGDAVDASKAAVIGAAMAVDDKLEDADDGIADAIDAAGDSAGDAVEVVVDTVEEVVDDAGDVVEETEVRLFGIEIDPDADVVDQITAKFPNLTEAQVAGLAGLVASVRKLDLDDAEKLYQAGVAKAADLLKMGASRQGRAQLAKETGIDESTILKWVNDLDLKRIKGVGVKYADLLETAGVDTVVELAHRNAANLFSKLVEVNEADALVDMLPSEEEVVDWVAQAKELPRVITY
ncbi:MAG: DUF4332 domain-containing protein [Candidatus Promineifilaceae bacterium]|jgi:uncharacterized membrane protein HdeD (DUF308 family)/predicted flap endonuclease-1-like 5' DNA nuclease